MMTDETKLAIYSAFEPELRCGELCSLDFMLMRGLLEGWAVVDGPEPSEWPTPEEAALIC